MNLSNYLDIILNKLRFKDITFFDIDLIDFCIISNLIEFPYAKNPRKLID